MSMLVRTDAQLKNAVEEELRWISSIDSTHIGVAVEGGTVTLSGHVARDSEKALVLKMVRRSAPGTTSVVDELTSTELSDRFTASKPTIITGEIMSQYEQRLAIVANALAAEQVRPAKGKTLAEAAVKVLAAIDEIKETIR